MTVPLSYTEQKSVLEGLEAVNAKQRLELEDAALTQVDLEGQVFDLKEKVKELEDEAARVVGWRKEKERLQALVDELKAAVVGAEDKARAAQRWGSAYPADRKEWTILVQDLEDQIAKLREAKRPRAPKKLVRALDAEIQEWAMRKANLDRQAKELEAERGAFECNEQSFVAEIHRLRDALEVAGADQARLAVAQEAYDLAVARNGTLVANIGRLERQVSVQRLGIRAALSAGLMKGEANDSNLTTDLQALLQETP